MFWLVHPPYLRWVAAAAIVAAAFLWDLRGSATQPFPFADRDIAAGETIDDAAVAWVEVPRGLMESPDLAAPFAARGIAAGEPITAAAIASTEGIPDGWWAVPVALPTTATRGSEVRLVIGSGDVTVPGIVVTPASNDLLSMSEAGLVAVPGEQAPAVATAAIEGTLVVLFAP